MPFHLDQRSNVYAVKRPAAPNVPGQATEALLPAIRHPYRSVVFFFESRAPEPRFFDDSEDLLDSPVTQNLSMGSLCLAYSESLSWRGTRSKASRKAELLLELELLRGQHDA
ncbi:hypothetical protein PG984_006251 [Apiospora sp. TS-2023a]